MSIWKRLFGGNKKPLTQTLSQQTTNSSQADVSKTLQEILEGQFGPTDVKVKAEMEDRLQRGQTVSEILSEMSDSNTSDLLSEKMRSMNDPRGMRE